MKALNEELYVMQTTSLTYAITSAIMEPAASNLMPEVTLGLVRSKINADETGKFQGEELIEERAITGLFDKRVYNMYYDTCTIQFTFFLHKGSNRWSVKNFAYN